MQTNDWFLGGTRWFPRRATEQGSGSGLDLAVKGLGLSFQAPELSLDEVGQGLPHFQLRGKFREGTFECRSARANNLTAHFSLILNWF